MDIGFYTIVTKQRSYFKIIILTLAVAFILTLTQTLIPTLTLAQAIEN